MSDRQSKWGCTIANGVCVGFVLGALIPCIDMFPEFAKRLSWAHAGGSGESAAWGEPLFYMLILGFSAGMVGALTGIVLIIIMRWRGRA
jgi:hypothetical protein